MSDVSQREVSELPLALDRDRFLRNLINHLAGTLEDIVGMREASGLVSVVGQALGQHINGAYCTALSLPHLERKHLAAVLVDLKRRIEGDFYVIEEDAGKIVLGNRVCPFGEYVQGRPSLCMMTSNVFGHISAESMGYAKVAVETAIARGHETCRVTVYLQKSPASDAVEGREYFKSA